MNTDNTTKKPTLKALSGFALVGLSALAFSGCSNKAVVSYGDAQAV